MTREREEGMYAAHVSWLANSLQLSLAYEVMGDLAKAREIALPVYTAAAAVMDEFDDMIYRGCA